MDKPFFATSGVSAGVVGRGKLAPSTIDFRSGLGTLDVGLRSYAGKDLPGVHHPTNYTTLERKD